MHSFSLPWARKKITAQWILSLLIHYMCMHQDQGETRIRLSNYLCFIVPVVSAVVYVPHLIVSVLRAFPENNQRRCTSRSYFSSKYTLFSSTYIRYTASSESTCIIILRTDFHATPINDLMQSYAILLLEIVYHLAKKWWCVCVLLLNVHGQQLRSCWDGQLT